MTLRTKKIISFSILSLTLLLIAGPTFAQYGLNETANAAGLLQGGKGRTVTEIIAIIINVALSLVGIGFLVLLIYAGFIYMTAREDQKAAEEAIKTIKNAVIGLLIVLAAYAITAFIMSRLIKPISEPGVSGEGIYQIVN